MNCIFCLFFSISQRDLYVKDKRNSKHRTNVRKTIYKIRKMWYNKNESESFRFLFPILSNIVGELLPRAERPEGDDFFDKYL